MPDIGEGLTEVEIIKWFVAVGDTVKVDQLIVEVETAKTVSSTERQRPTPRPPRPPFRGDKRVFERGGSASLRAPFRHLREARARRE